MKNTKDFLKNLNGENLPLKELMRALILCHNSKVIYDHKTDRNVYVANRKEVEAVLNFAR